ncbi:MAG: hypothetical protein ACK5TH_11950 [Prosthecobacter sp.]
MIAHTYAIMKRAALRFAAFAGIFITGIFVGAVMGIGLGKERLHLLHLESYPLAFGKVEWRHFTRSSGFEMMAIDHTRLEFRGRVLYEAGRDFQENRPFARNIKVQSNQIEWDDGDYRYQLVIDATPSD